MHAPTRLRGNLAVRVGVLVLGLWLCSLGIVAMLESHLGLSPWDVLHQGLARHSPLSFGEANVAVGIFVLACAWLLGAGVGLGTVANSVLIGTFVQLLSSWGLVSGVSDAPLPARIGLLTGGVLTTGIGSGFYLGAALGAGPRDSLMVIGSARTGIRVGSVRIAIEVTALVVGIVLGGTVGAGTVVFALAIGPIVELSFWLLARSPLARPDEHHAHRGPALRRVAEAAATIEPF